MSRLARYILALVLSVASGCSTRTASPEPQTPSGADSASQATDSASQATDSTSQAPGQGASVQDWQSALIDVQEGRAQSLQLDQAPPSALLDALPRLDGQLEDLLLDGGLERCADDLAAVVQIKSLMHLRIRQCKLDDSAAGLLTGALPRLQILNLPQAEFTAAGIRKLAELPSLRQLRIGGRQIRDAEAIALAELPKLQSLHLIGVSITGEGLAALGGAPKLVSLYIDDCPLPDEAWQQLFASKPKLHVHIDQQHHDRDPNGHAH